MWNNPHSIKLIKKDVDTAKPIKDVEFVNEDVFSNCTNLETVVFPEKLKSGKYEERWNDETYEYEKLYIK